MGRLMVSEVEEAEISSFPRLEGVAAEGNIESRAVIGGEGQGLLLWSHRLSPGAEITWRNAPVGHALYLWEGEVSADGSPVTSGGAVIVEHEAKARIAAGPGGAQLLHFHERDRRSDDGVRLGGRVHIVNSGDALHYQPGGGTVYLDSGCPTCELWLHRNEMSATEMGTPRHMHTEDEIIVVVGGTMRFGTRHLEKGTALAIGANSAYSFAPGPEGLCFINFRARDPHFVLLSSNGRGRPISERLAVNELARGTEAGRDVLREAAFE